MQRSQRIEAFRKEFIIFLFPPALIIAGYFAFDFLAAAMGPKQGFLTALLLYWLGGCLLPVFLWISRRDRKLLWKIKPLKAWQLLLLLLPPAFALYAGPYTGGSPQLTVPVILLSLPLAAANAFCEEFLWRGLYYDHHQANFFYAAIVPAAWFGIWQYVPLSILPSAIGNFYFILGAIGMGLCWSIITWQTRSLFWGFISHTMVNWAGLGALYFLD